MPRYTAIATSRGPLRTGAPHRLPVNVAGTHLDIVVRTLISYHERGWDFRGIRLVFEFEADDIHRAANLIDSASDFLLSVFAVSAAAEVPQLHLELIYEDTPGKPSGEMLRFLVAPLPELRLRKIYWHHLEPIFLQTLTVDPKLSDRIRRSLWWYRRALGEADPLNRFSALWVGLETLNPRLSELWQLADEGLPGVTRLLTDIPEGGERIARRAKRLRNEILHGYEELYAAETTASQLMPALEASIPRGIARLLRLPEEVENSLARAPLPPMHQFTFFVYVQYRRDPGEPVGPPDTYPHLQADIQSIVEYGEDKGPAQYHFESTVEVVCAPNIAIERVYSAVRLRDGTEIPARVSYTTSYEPVQVPFTPRGLGVSLWERSDERAWTPQYR